LAEYIKYALVFIFLAVTQKTIIWLISVTEYEITPDLVLIALVFFSIRNGKIAGSIGGFLVGLFFDILSFTFIGLMALSKCFSGFTAGFFNNESKIERFTTTYIFPLIVLLCSLFNNTIYYWLYFQGTNQVFVSLILKYILPTALYTTVVSFIPVIIFSRKKRR
jgi:rod shape-determining protein MreD